jgi:hypothetical protein
VTVLFVLILITCILVAIVAVSVGQVLVRRQQGQMVVDAAALAGAGSQARGLNTIAVNNQNSLMFLQMVEISTYLPYVDSNSTTNERYFAALASGMIALPFTSDWAGDVLEDYQGVFDLFNTFTDLVNLAYSPISPMPFAPRREAEKVIDENFGDEDEALFREADLQNQGVVIPPHKLVDIDAMTHLVKLTEPEEYDIGSHYYAFNPEHWSLETCELIFPLDAPCIHLMATYGSLNAYYLGIESHIDPIKYELGKFYDNDEGDDVRFVYSLTISQSPVLFGKSFFDDIPPITVAAAAKPFGGYLGDTFEDGTWKHEERSGKEISPTYQPKLVPMRTLEKCAVDLDECTSMLH